MPWLVLLLTSLWTGCSIFASRPSRDANFVTNTSRCSDLKLRRYLDAGAFLGLALAGLPLSLDCSEEEMEGGECHIRPVGLVAFGASALFLISAIGGLAKFSGCRDLHEEQPELPPISKPTQEQSDAVAFSSARNENTFDAYLTYVLLHPHGRYVELAEKRMEALGGFERAMRDMTLARLKLIIEADRAGQFADLARMEVLRRSKIRIRVVSTEASGSGDTTRLHVEIANDSDAPLENPRYRCQADSAQTKDGAVQYQSSRTEVLVWNGTIAPGEAVSATAALALAFKSYAADQIVCTLWPD